MKNYVSRIKAVLKKNGKYNDGMTLLIDSTAIEYEIGRASCRERV